MIDFYLTHTQIVPSGGGLLREGVVGQPRFINPIYAEGNDIDRDIASLIFSGLMKYDEAGNVIYDLATSHEIKEGGRIYEIEINQSATFHDGTPISAKDVVFTIKTIQNPDFKSPLFAKWIGVEAEKISDYKVKFVLQNPYPGFLENLSIKILPSHIWEKILPQNFPLSDYNFRPIGSGPYLFKNLTKDKEGFIQDILLEHNKNYYGKISHIAQIKFVFYKEEDYLIADALSGSIDSLSASSPKNYSRLESFKKHSFILPRYFAIFLNSKENKYLQEKDVKIALNLAINKNSIKDDILFGQGTIVSSPLLPDIYNFETDGIKNEFNPSLAKELLLKSGIRERDGNLVIISAEQKMNFTKTLDVGSKGAEVENLQKCLSMFEDIYPQKEITGIFGIKTKAAVIKFQEKYPDDILKPAGIKSGNGKVGPATREKLNEVCVTSPEIVSPFEIIITTSQDPLLKEIAKKIQEQWKEIGIKAELETYEISEIKQRVIKDRDYQMFLFGQVLGMIPDPFSFWHSSQKNHPGLNLSNYQNKNLDKILEDIRIESDGEKIKTLLKNAQKILIDDMPAIFLCNPYYVYFISGKINGVIDGLIVDPSKRFSGIENWYINTKRAFK